MKKDSFKSDVTQSMRMFVLLVIGVSFLFGSVGCSAQDNANKIATVDLNKVIQSYNRSKELSDQLKSEIQKRQEQVTKSRGEIEKLGKEYNENLEKLSKKEKQMKEGILKQRVTDLREMEQKFNLELRNMQMDMQSEVSDKINEAAKKAARKEGYSLVISKAVVIYNGAKGDISDKVINELNKK